jgi:hypothetical protein
MKNNRSVTSQFTQQNIEESQRAHEAFLRIYMHITKTIVFNPEWSSVGIYPDKLIRHELDIGNGCVAKFTTPERNKGIVLQVKNGHNIVICKYWASENVYIAVTEPIFSDLFNSPLTSEEIRYVWNGKTSPLYGLLTWF